LRFAKHGGFPYFLRRCKRLRSELLLMPFRRLHVLCAAWLFVLPFCCSAFAENSAPIRFLVKPKIFVLDAGKVSYVFGINEQNMLQHLYWGAHIARDDDFPPRTVFRSGLRSTWAVQPRRRNIPAGALDFTLSRA
jgi:hypothetical protein